MLLLLMMGIRRRMRTMIVMIWPLPICGLAGGVTYGGTRLWVHFGDRGGVIESGP